MKASYKGQILAESDDIVELDKGIYFPLSSVHTEFLTPSEHTSYCGWKGDCKYYNVEVPGAEPNANACWYYPEPYDAAKQIEGRVAFWKGVEVTP